MQFQSASARCFLILTPPHDLRPAALRKFTKILNVDRRMYGTTDDVTGQLTDGAPIARRASGSVSTSNKRKRPH